MLIKNQFIRSVLVLILTLAVYPAGAAEITVSVDRNPAALNESFVMIFESDGEVDADPDFSLLNRDFQIISSGVSSNMSIVNGEVTSNKRWTLNVIARRTGTLGIPPIPFGKDTSTPSTVEVVREVTTGGNDDSRDVFIEVEATPVSPYVQSEVVYKIRLFRSVATANASLSDPPEVEGGTAVIEKLGDDRSYDTRINGKLFGVIERQYAVFPQSSGPMTIKPVVFQGQISRGASFFSSPFGRQPKTVIVRSDPVALNVQPVPDSFKGAYWLPAREVTLMEEWSEYPLEFEVDQPLTRTLTITAEGLAASQLPELPAWSLNEFKQYPDQPVMEEDSKASGVIGRRTEKVALIPTMPGSYNLPEIRIPWWNTVSGKIEYATIPARQITITSPAAAQQPVARPQFGPPPIGDLELPEIVYDDSISTADNEPGSSAVPPSVIPEDTRLWQGVALALLIIWLLTLLLLWRARKQRIAQAAPGKGADSGRYLVKDLKRACATNQPVLAKEKLLAWGRSHWSTNPPGSIGEIANRCHDALAREIRNLNNALYSRSAKTWDGKNLWQAFVQELKHQEKKTTTETGNLEPLFRI